MKNLKLPQNYYRFVSKYLNIIVLVLVIIVLSILIYFLYYNFYLTLSEAKEVTTLQKRIISEGIQKEKFNKIISNINEKIKATQTITIPISTSTIIQVDIKNISTSSTSTISSTTEPITTSSKVTSTKATKK